MAQIEYQGENTRTQWRSHREKLRHRKEGSKRPLSQQRPARSPEGLGVVRKGKQECLGSLSPGADRPYSNCGRAQPLQTLTIMGAVIWRLLET